MVLEKQDSGICLAMDTGSPNEAKGEGSGGASTPSSTFNRARAGLDVRHRMRDREKLNRLAARYTPGGGALSVGASPNSDLGEVEERQSVPDVRGGVEEDLELCPDEHLAAHKAVCCAICRRRQEGLRRLDLPKEPIESITGASSEASTNRCGFADSSVHNSKFFKGTQQSPTGPHNRFGSPLGSPNTQRDDNFEEHIWERRSTESSRSLTTPSTCSLRSYDDLQSGLESPDGQELSSRNGQHTKSSFSDAPSDKQTGDRDDISNCNKDKNNTCDNNNYNNENNNKSSHNLDKDDSSSVNNDENYSIWRRQSLSSRDKPGYLATVKRASSVKDKQRSPQSFALSRRGEKLTGGADEGKNGREDGGGTDLECSLQSSEQSTDSSQATSPGAKSPSHTPGSGLWQQKLQGALNSFTSKFSNKQQQQQRQHLTTRTERPARPAVKPQDQKILALMLAKKEAESIQRTNRELTQSQWESKRREELGRPGRGLGGLGAGPMDSAARKERRAAAAAAAAAAEGEREGERSSGAGAKGSSQLLRDKKLSVKEKHSVTVDKRRSVEQRLEQQRREMEEQKELLRQKQEEDLMRAESIRASRDQQLLLKSKLKKVAEQQRMEKLHELKHQSMLELNDLQVAIETKMSVAEQNLQRQREKNSRRHRELQQKIEQSRERQRQTEAELKKWQEELMLFKDWQGQHAEKLARQALLKKKEAACNERLKKEKQQRDNINKLLEKEEQWLAEVEANILEKEARSAMVARDREEVIQQSRAMAATTQRMREELRSHYSMSDLDKWSQQASLEHRLITRKSSNMGSNTSINSMFL